MFVDKDGLSFRAPSFATENRPPPAYLAPPRQSPKTWRIATPLCQKRLFGAGFILRCGTPRLVVRKVRHRERGPGQGKVGHSERVEKLLIPVIKSN